MVVSDDRAVIIVANDPVNPITDEINGPIAFRAFIFPSPGISGKDFRIGPIVSLTEFKTSRRAAP